MTESGEEKPPGGDRPESVEAGEARREARRRSVVSRWPLALMIGLVALGFMVPSLFWRDSEKGPILLLFGFAGAASVLALAWPALRRALLARPEARDPKDEKGPSERPSRKAVLLTTLACVLGAVLIVGAAAAAVFFLPPECQHWIMPALAALIVAPLFVSGVRRAASLKLWELAYAAATLLVIPFLLWPSGREMADVSPRVWLFLLLIGLQVIPVGLSYRRRWASLDPEGVSGPRGRWARRTPEA